MINKERKTRIVNFRVTESFLAKVRRDAKRNGFKNLSKYITSLLEKNG